MEMKINVELTLDSYNMIVDLLTVEQELTQRELRKLSRDRNCPGDVYQKKIDRVETVGLALVEMTRNR